MRIDHVTLAAAELEAMRRRFAEIGLGTDYGGPHSNGVTHMALLGFEDGSYVELISTLVPGAVSPLWDGAIRGNAGPAAWAVEVSDLADEKQRLARAGVTAQGPLAMTRSRPDGVRLEWELLFPGGDPPGATLPFAIRDRTARALRVTPSPSVADSELTGVAGVIIGVGRLEETTALFRRAYQWPEPFRMHHPGLGARLARFPDTPVILAEPAEESNWLAQRLGRYGASPAAFILATEDLARSAHRLPLLAAESWFDGELGWIDPGQLFGWRVGLLAQPS